MAYAQPQRTRDRWESDLLLQVVRTHLACCSARDEHARNEAHDRFKSAVGELHRFLFAEAVELPVSTSDARANRGR